MKKLLLSLLLTTPLIAQHSKETDVMLVSMPKSGSNFFANTLVSINPAISYLHEYFNKIQTEQMANFLNVPFTRKYEEFFFALEITPDQFEHMYNVTWKHEAANFTKEVFSAFRIPLFQEKFTMFALYRHRKYTFPTNSNHLYLPLYKSFEQVIFKNPELAAIKEFVTSIAKTDEEKECAIHTISNYIILRDCAQYNLPVMDYTELLTLSGKQLEQYLETRVPHQIYHKELAVGIEANREPAEFLAKRKEKFNKANLEPFCQKVINFLKARDPEMPYWFLFE